MTYDEMLEDAKWTIECLENVPDSELGAAGIQQLEWAKKRLNELNQKTRIKMKTITIIFNNLEAEIEYFDDGESPVLFNIESVNILGADFPLDDLSAAVIDKIRGLICKKLGE